VLEPAIEAGRVRDERQAAAWLVDQLQLTLARSDLAVVAAAFHAWQQPDVQRLRSLNDWVRHSRESSELLQQSEQMGRSLLEWLRNHGENESRLTALASLQPAPTWPVAFALAALQTGAPVREGLLAFAFGWAENMVQAAIKAMPLGQSAGQRILRRLSEAIPAAADHALALEEDRRQAFAPMLAILSARHETQYSRLFRS
jgi:urease accessory protein